MNIHINISDELPSELIKNGVINYRMILSKIIVSYFSIRTRFVTQSDVFNIGKFEFKVVGGRPW